MKKNILKTATALILFLVLLAGNISSTSASTLVINKAKPKTKAVKTIHTHQTLQIKVKGVRAKKIKWRVSNKKVASISKKGLLTAKKKGTVTVTAKIKKKKYKRKIKVIGANIINANNVGGSLLKQGIYLLDEQDHGKNIIVSPLSVNMVLGMVSNAVAGSTDILSGNKKCMPSLSVYAKQQVEKYLGMPTDKYNIYAKEQIDKSKKGNELKLANAIWYKNTLHVNENFKDTVGKYYCADVNSAAFDMGSVNQINNWVKENTDGRIDKVIDETDTSTISYILNALLFKAQWTDPIEKYDVFNEKFTRFDHKNEIVKMMRCSEDSYYENDYAVAFEKTYGKDRKYSFIGILPKTKDNFKLLNLNINTLLKNKKNNVVNINFPKFSYGWNSDIRSTLEKMNVSYIFNPNYNPLGNMFTDSKNAYISKVLHCCDIMVDEKGTEAAAVTVATIKSSLSFTKSKAKKIVLNRPFAYLIRDNDTGDIIFAGKVTDPLQK